MAFSDINIAWKMRKAFFMHPSRKWYKQHNVLEAHHLVTVHGIFPYAESHEDGTMTSYPVASIELPDGRMFSVPVETIRFLSKEA